MAKRRRPKKRESPPEPAAADTPLRPGAEKEAEEKEAAEGGGGGRPFRVPPEPAAQDEEAGAARRGGGGGRGGDVSSRALRGPRRRGPGGGGRRGGGGGGSSSRSHSQSFPASRLRPPRRRCRTACWERGAVPAPARPGHRGRGREVGAGPGGRGKRTALQRPGLASTPRGQRQGPGPAAGAHGRGDLRYHPSTHTLPARPGKHLTHEGRAVRCKQTSNQGRGVPAGAGARAYLSPNMRSRFTCAHLSHPVR